MLVFSIKPGDIQRLIDTSIPVVYFEFQKKKDLRELN